MGRTESLTLGLESWACDGEATLLADAGEDPSDGSSGLHERNDAVPLLLDLRPRSALMPLPPATAPCCACPSTSPSSASSMRGGGPPGVRERLAAPGAPPFDLRLWPSAEVDGPARAGEAGSRRPEEKEEEEGEGSGARAREVVEGGRCSGVATGVSEIYRWPWYSVLASAKRASSSHQLTWRWTAGVGGGRFRGVG